MELNLGVMRVGREDRAVAAQAQPRLNHSPAVCLKIVEVHLEVSPLLLQREGEPRFKGLAVAVPENSMRLLVPEAGGESVMLILPGIRIS